jgi:hypothetical protein
MVKSAQAHYEKHYVDFFILKIIILPASTFKRSIQAISGFFVKFADNFIVKLEFWFIILKYAGSVFGEDNQN